MKEKVLFPACVNSTPELRAAAIRIHEILIKICTREKITDQWERVGKWKELCDAYQDDKLDTYE